MAEVRTIFDERTVFMFGKSDFDVVEWNDDFEGLDPERTSYKDLKAGYVGTASAIHSQIGIEVPGSDSWSHDTEFLVLITKEGDVVKYPNNEVALFHMF